MRGSAALGALRFAGVVGMACALSGCGKRLSTMVKEHAADYAALDAMVARANAEVAKVPDRGTRAFPRCKPQASYVFNTMGDGHNTDMIGAELLAGYPSAIEDALKVRKDSEGKGRFSGPKASPFDEARLNKLKNIKNLVVIREHKESSDDHVSADIFLVTASTGKITCAFGFDGGEGSYGSVGKVTGKEVWTNKKTGQKVRERDIVEGASSGTSGAYAAKNKLPFALARNLGISISYNTADAAAKAIKGGEPGLGEYPTIKIGNVLEDRGASHPRDTWSRQFGMANFWDTDGIHVTCFSADKEPAVAIGGEQAVSVFGADAAQLAAELVERPLGGPSELVARLRALGYAPAAALPMDAPKTGRGYRLYVQRAKKGRADATITVLDYSDAAQKRNNTALRIEGKKIVIVQGTSPILGPAEEIATEIAK